MRFKCKGVDDPTEAQKTPSLTQYVLLIGEKQGNREKRDKLM